ncbi:uncharacterized protein LOC127744171 isoform X2 [Arachis duranensis]|uniref:Uncharacterized protein LOC107461993 isoform X2 n=1 Tax=Arachis duranensis TaxID=130453 RepID=A0A6P4B4B2_ARADU|nr:uncharacterized protein LOC107461993 isoform X2 [Arachis duranensis]XP_052112415.1 uncharacterized protein LOC127744171 isoform X2 [Arachis duranensis]
MKKKGSKNKFFTCIRPVVDIDSMLEPKTTIVDRSSSRRFSCIPAVSEKHEEDWINVTQSNPPKRKLAKNKRAQHKNHFGSSKGCFPVYSSSSSSPSSSMDTKTKKALELYSPVSKSKDTSKHVNPNNRDHQLLESYKTFRCIIGVLLFLISLSITIIWGKFKGIVLTSIWLYFISLLITCFRRRTTKIMV